MKLLIIAVLVFVFLFTLVYIQASGDYVFESGDFCKYYGCNKNGIDGQPRK